MWKSFIVFVTVLILLSVGIAKGIRLDVTQPGDAIQGVPNDNDWPGNEAPPLAIDDNTTTKYLHFKGDFDPDPQTGGAGFQVTPSTRQTVVVGLSFTTANDVPGRDPVAYELSGSNASIHGPYELIAAGEIVDFQQAADWPRFTMNETPIVFDNEKPFNHYQLIFTAIRGPVGGGVNSVQIAEVELLGMSTVSSDPVPADGSIHPDTWVGLSWSPGGQAASHDVYFGDDFDQVNNGSGGTFQGNQTLTYFVVGFPGLPFPDGLVPGTTYYWRIDDVEADGATKHKGAVWSFLVPPKTAYNPTPTDGSKFIAADAVLSWTGGFDAVLHTVYFGDDFDTVNNAVGGIPQGIDATYDPGPLEPGTTYYWRIDEFDGAVTYTGEVWSFTTAKEGGGLRADYFHWMGDFPPPEPFQVFVTGEIVPEINWNWGNNSPNPLVNVDDFACKFTGEVEAAFTETYTFYVTTDDGQRLWVDNQLIIDRWVQQGMTEHNGTIDLVAGQKYSIELWMYEHGGGAGCEMRWSSPGTPKQIVPQAALSPPLKAMNPRPANEATGAKMTPILTWDPGDHAASHEVYFGTNAEAVANATRTSPEFKTAKVLGDESYDPGQLAWHTTYYWRVDEVNHLHPESPWTGNLWSFTTGDFLVVDDFEDYTDDDSAGEAIWQHWIDGFGVAGNGSQVGYLLPPYAEQTIVHSGSQSMPLSYNNSAGVTNSEAVLTLTWARDWTEQDVAELSLWFHGDPANAAERLYMAVSSTSGAPAVEVNDDPAAATTDSWTEWRIPLQAFVDQDINLTNVDKLAIGLGTKAGVTGPGGSGTMYIDDIRLYRSAG